VLVQDGLESRNVERLAEKPDDPGLLRRGRARARRDAHDPELVAIQTSSQSLEEVASTRRSHLPIEKNEAGTGDGRSVQKPECIGWVLRGKNRATGLSDGLEERLANVDVVIDDQDGPRCRSASGHDRVVLTWGEIAASDYLPVPSGVRPRSARRHG